MPNDTSRVEIMTWGTAPFDSKYLSPLMKGIKGKNPGHGAFSLNLEDTPKHRNIYLSLKAVGYPCSEITQPMAEGGEQIRYIIRFSPYSYEFAEYKHDHMRQRGHRDFFMDQKRYWDFKKQDLDLQLPDEMTENFEGTKLQEISNQAKKDTKLYQFESGQVGATQIIHINRLTQEDLNDWDNRDMQASDRRYETIGQPPDRIDHIPISNEDFAFGLDVNKLAKEMLRVKKAANKKVYTFVCKNTDPQNPRLENHNLEIEKNIIKAAYPDKTIPMLFKPTFNELMIARKVLLKLGDNKEESQTKALNEFDELLIRYGQYAGSHHLFVQKEISRYLFNCCMTVKNCVRKGLDSTYKGYLSDPLTTNLGTVPLELAQEAGKLSDAIYKDRINSQAPANKPPILSRIKGFFVRAKNLNYTFLPSRMVIRPIFIFLNILISPFLAIYNFITAPSLEKEVNKNEIPMKENIEYTYTTDKELLNKVLEYKNGDALFFIDNQSYNHIVKDLRSVKKHFKKAKATLLENLALYQTILEKDSIKNEDKINEVEKNIVAVNAIQKHENSIDNIKFFEAQFKPFGGFNSKKLKDFEMKYNEILKDQAISMQGHVKGVPKPESITLQYTVYRSEALNKGKPKKGKAKKFNPKI